ncbi:angiopoietin-2 [Protopterus annectens]|uniref:angiopoietin-2 n=1 Tax=Protopterus annectens TaxID=7888 RepID=UPI001CFA3BE5|nr:angiopoietin-2 [Protopterus annectens]
MWLVHFFCISCSLALDAGSSSLRKSTDNISKKHYQVQHGPCSYTFLLPEIDNCRFSSTSYANNAVQKDAPVGSEDSMQRLQELENIMENNTQWLMKLEGYIQDSMKKMIAKVQQNAVQNQTAVMIEIGTSLLTQTAEQTRKLTEVQVLNQTSRLEIQLLENSLSTNKLEKQILLQTTEISTLQQKNCLLEKKVMEMEDKHKSELDSLKEEKVNLQEVISRQNPIIEDLEKQLMTATVNNSALQKQQIKLMETVNNLLTKVADWESKSLFMAEEEEEQIHFKDCADVYKSGLTTSGIYVLTVLNSTEQVRAFCDMETAGGGWTVIQRRQDGSLDFQRTWKEYKMGFGDPAKEYWLGNEIVSKLTNYQTYSLRIALKDWEGNEAYSQYDDFHLGNEIENYRISLKGYGGTAGKVSSLSQPGNEFSTKDADNDKCICKCAHLATGGWWFDACGPSNLNGVHYPLGENTNKFNGIKWYYWKGSSYSLKATTMMIRPANF